MKEIKELDIILCDEGWDPDDQGQSRNVWGRVPFPEKLLEYLDLYRNYPQYFFDDALGKKIDPNTAKASIWTAFDDYIYTNEDIKSEDLPRISATFKSCFDRNKYSAVAENIGMKIATELDMPTSYNYIVKFDPNKYPEIFNSYRTNNDREHLLPFGIVSIDFLQNKKSPRKTGVSYYNDEEIESISEIEGDRLVTFEDALNKYNVGLSGIEGKQNLIENWIDVVDNLAKNELKSIPKEELNRKITHIHSRIARSFLLKDILLGDCDFTPYNGGIVINKFTKKIRYAPNFDYGESFNGLIANKLKFDPLCGMSNEEFNKLPENVKPIIMANMQKRANKSMREIATNWASASSKENFYYVLENFPNASREFFESLDQFLQKGKIDTIIDTYSELTCNGIPLLTNEEADLFKEYLYERIAHYCELYTDYLIKNGQEVPQIAYSEKLNEYER